MKTGIEILYEGIRREAYNEVHRLRNVEKSEIADCTL